MSEPPDASQRVAVADKQLDYSQVRETQEAMERSMDAAKNPRATRQSAWVRLAYEFLKFISGYPWRH